MSSAMRVCCLLIVAAASSCWAQTCDLSDHDLTTANLLLGDSNDAWYASMPARGCVGDVADNEDCVLYFRVCEELPQIICDETGLGMCQTVQTKATPPVVKEHYELGKESSAINVTKGEDGFLIEYSTDTTTNPDCDKNMTRVVVAFQCDSDAVWSQKDLNVTEYLVAFFPDPVDSCMIVGLFNYSGACIQATPIQPPICSSLQHYDGTGLLKRPTWLVHLKGDQCYKQSGLPSSDEYCYLFFSFCSELTASYCVNSMICEVLFTQPGELEVFSFAEYDVGFRYLESDNGDGFVGNFEKGTVSPQCPEGLTAVVNFVCDKKADWTTLPNNNITKYVGVAASPGYCEIYLRVNYSGACGEPFTPPAPEQSIVGWVFIGVTVLVFIVYFVVGVVIQLVRGKKGINIIPNVGFWKDFPELILDGCRLVVDTVTCYKASKAKVTDYDKL